MLKNIGRFEIIVSQLLSFHNKRRKFPTCVNAYVYVRVVKSIFRFEMSAAVKIGKTLTLKHLTTYPFRNIQEYQPIDFLLVLFLPVITTIDF